MSNSSINDIICDVLSEHCSETDKSAKCIESLEKILSIYEFISASYHEASHTVYGLLNFMYVHTVSVFRNEDCDRIEGLTEYNSAEIDNIQDNLLFNKLLTCELCMNYAGFAGERHYFKTLSGCEKLPMVFKNGSSIDTALSSKLFKKYNLFKSGKKRAEFKNQLIEKTSEDLKEHWGDVTIVAHKIFQKKKLKFEDLRNLLLSESKNKGFWKKQFKTFDTIYNNENVNEALLNKIFENKRCLTSCK